ncbi:hypothetical protein COU91_02275 [Candidatus Saccharibacteria bacterium CG10_big_fil_rev_8_21_14_0_10_47_8]|nr:MAG: hypothetical protein COU91_02275 [Candidatus Saccharibacteria bacterium CG10_big_fil_rev_8_21_14_0_10_47_8]
MSKSPPIVKKETTFTSAGKDYKLFMAKPGHPKAAVIVIHEIWGLNNDIKRIASQFAEAGFLAVAPDLYSQHSPVRVVMDAVFARVFGSTFKEHVLLALRDLVDFIHKDYGIQPGKIGITGFCFGGTYTYLYTTRYHDIGAAVPFYGQNPPLDEVKKINTPILAFYGKNDKFLMPKVPALVKAFTKAKTKFTHIEYEDVGHSFMNKKLPGTYKPKAARDAWRRSLGFLQQNTGAA